VDPASGGIYGSRLFAEASFYKRDDITKAIKATLYESADMQPIIEDQYTAARAYFLCVIGLLLCEACIQLPSYLLTSRRQGK
jgi:hypothetical protein